MHEKSKLSEAHYFYSRMGQEIDSHEEFIFNLSAFLSAARSVLQYVFEEAKNKSGGQMWYDNQISNSRILAFFKDKRDINIHQNPILPDRQTNIEVTLHLSTSVSFTVIDENGSIVSQSPEETKQTVPENTSKIYYSYTFGDWRGSEDILALSKKYLVALENIVNEGITKKFNSG